MLHACVLLRIVDACCETIIAFFPTIHRRLETRAAEVHTSWASSTPLESTYAQHRGIRRCMLAFAHVDSVSCKRGACGTLRVIRVLACRFRLCSGVRTSICPSPRVPGPAARIVVRSASIVQTCEHQPLSQGNMETHKEHRGDRDRRPRPSSARDQWLLLLHRRTPGFVSGYYVIESIFS